MVIKDLLSSTGNSIQYYVAAWMGDGFGAEWIHVYVIPFAVYKGNICINICRN